MNYINLDLLEDDQVSEIKTAAHKFAKEILRPASFKLDKLSPEEVIDKNSELWSVFKHWYSQSQHTISLPKELGGIGLTPLQQWAIFEELGWGASDLAISLGVSSFAFSLAASLALLTGNKRVLDEVITPFYEDKDANFIGCWAITEPDHGSDELAVGTDVFESKKISGGCRATKKGSDWVLNGQKSAWVSNGSIASHALLFCTIEPEIGMKGGGVAIVPLNSKGVKRGMPLNKLGQRGLNQGEIFFDEVHIPEEYLLVAVDGYPEAVDATLASANAGMAVIFSGCARAAFEEALSYSLVRIQGGKPISQHQLIQKKLFDMFIKTKQCQSLSQSVFIYNSTHIPPELPYSVAAKVACTQGAYEVAHSAIQIFGGLGLSKESLVEKLFRDTRASLIEDGVNEFLELVGAQQVIKKYKPEE